MDLLIAPHGIKGDEIVVVTIGQEVKRRWRWRRRIYDTGSRSVNDGDDDPSVGLVLALIFRSIIMAVVTIVGVPVVEVPEAQIGLCGIGICGDAEGVAVDVSELRLSRGRGPDDAGNPDGAVI